MPKQEPRLMRSPLTGTVYIVTKYTHHGSIEHGYISADEKFAVTPEQLAALGLVDTNLDAERAVERASSTPEGGE